MNDEKVNYVIEIIKDMDLENKLRCLCDNYSHSNLEYDKKEMYKYFDNFLKEINIEYRTTTVNFANYSYIIFVTSKIMKMDSAGQNINLDIKKSIINDKSEELINLYRCIKNNDKEFFCNLKAIYKNWTLLESVIENNSIGLLKIYRDYITDLNNNSESKR